MLEDLCEKSHRGKTTMPKERGSTKIKKGLQALLQTFSLGHGPLCRRRGLNFIVIG